MSTFSSYHHWRPGNGKIACQPEGGNKNLFAKRWTNCLPAVSFIAHPCVMCTMFHFFIFYSMLFMWSCSLYSACHFGLIFSPVVECRFHFLYTVTERSLAPHRAQFIPYCNIHRLVISLDSFDLEYVFFDS